MYKFDKRKGEKREEGENGREGEKRKREKRKEGGTERGRKEIEM